MSDIKITYEREVDHCDVSPYIKKVTITSVYPAENSDNLDCVKFAEIGWQAVSNRGLRKVGDVVLFIPAESVLPFELGEALDVTKYLSKGRVRVTRLRGNRSEGLIVEEEVVGPYLPYIMKWEDLPSLAMQGEQMSPSEVSLHMHRFYKMPNILNEPNTFDVGETLLFSEKIHGTNWRVGILPHPQTEIYQLYAGSHEVVLKNTIETIYWRAAQEVYNKLPPGILFFGEIFGIGIQDSKMTYGHKFGYRFFAATRQGVYISHDELKDICERCGLPCVTFHEITFENVDQLRELADTGKSTYADHIKEGNVYVSKQYPERMAKCLSFSYLEKKNRMERH